MLEDEVWTFALYRSYVAFHNWVLLNILLHGNDNILAAARLGFASRVNNNTRASRRGGGAGGERETNMTLPKPFGEGRATEQLLMGPRVISVK